MTQAEAALNEPALVIAGRDWNQGVIGIVASRLVEKYHKPTLVLCADGDTLKGSGRSISGFDLHAGLARCAEELLTFGGHRMAAGVRVLPEKLDAFRRRFTSVVREELGSDPVPAVQLIDGELDFKAATNFIFLKELGNDAALRRGKSRAGVPVAAASGETAQTVRPAEESCAS